jgi:dephospho-CoA kinase
MINVGLTGGIGSGKTTIAGYFADLGIAVYNSDLEARKLMQSSDDLRSEIMELFGRLAYNNDLLDRKYIASRVFNDKEALHRLNALVHPVVREHFRKWRALQSGPYTIQEAAVIFESGARANYDKIILVTAAEEERIARVMKRDGIEEEEVKARLRNQWSDSEKAKSADYIIVNSDRKKARSKVRAIHLELLKISG